MKKTKYFVFDANTLISAFLLSDTSVSARAYYHAKAQGELVISDDTFNEFGDVFIRAKFDKYLPLKKRLMIIEDLKSVMRFKAITVDIEVCRDPKDDKYLELAVSSDAMCIITGDKDLLVLHPFEHIQILTLRIFCKDFSVV